MAAPSPWPSRAVGDPVVRRHHTSEAEVGAPLIPLLDHTGQCPPREGASASRFMPMHRSATVISTLLPQGVHSHHWGLGFRAIKPSPCPQGRTQPAVQRLPAVAPFSQHALVPLIPGQQHRPPSPAMRERETQRAIFPSPAPGAHRGRGWIAASAARRVRVVKLRPPHLSAGRGVDAAADEDLGAGGVGGAPHAHSAGRAGRGKGRGGLGHRRGRWGWRCCGLHRRWRW